MKMEVVLEEKMWLKRANTHLSMSLLININFSEQSCIYMFLVMNVAAPLTHIYPTQNTLNIAYLIRVSIFPQP